MAIEDLMNYNQTIKYLDRALSLWGQPCTVFVPKTIIAVGYENQSEEDAAKLGVSGVGNQYTRYQQKIWINFKTTKSVFYRFNYFPEDSEDMVTAVMLAGSEIREEAYIRTAVPEQKSVWGDLIFQIKKIQDVGEFKTLQRLYFLKPTSNADLHVSLGLK